MLKLYKCISLSFINAYHYKCIPSILEELNKSDCSKGPSALIQSSTLWRLSRPIPAHMAWRTKTFGSPNPARPGDAPPNGGTQDNMGEQAVPRPAAAGESVIPGSLNRPETVGDDSILCPT